MNRQSIYGVRRTILPAAVLITAFGGAVLAPPAEATGFYAEAAPRDIDMCVAEVRARADVRDAARVRHFVASTKRTVGYSIEIETTVYAPGSGGVLREYETVCVATGGEQPARFTMREIR
ncbi:MAG TPA: hypothetical protein VFY03_11590 [Woeseiaceae bacterium]|nr:hypothetical protein [Woeseiaceae bacterium]